MNTLKLFIDTTANSLIVGFDAPQSVNPLSLPLYYGDTLPLQVQLLNKTGTTLAGYNPFAIIPTNGLQLFVYLDDGKIAGTIYTQQITWTTDANNQYWTANLALNTAAIATLIGASVLAQAWLKVGYVQGGTVTTVLSQLVNIGVGIPASGLVVPPGLTPLSVEVANATYFPLSPVAGMGLYLMSPLGKIIMLNAVDNPDGTASFNASPIN